jgi:16S rRNA (guanine527-N7)-methyltransferase
VEHVAEVPRPDLDLPAPPDGLAALFGDRWGLVGSYVDRLATVAVERGLIGPREQSRLWDRHIANCAAIAPIIPIGATVADVGSGAGLPGIVLALLRPDLQLDLIEASERRVVFLRETLTELALSNVVVVRGRAEELAGHRRYDVVTARAVAPLERLLGWVLPLTKPGGVLLALKGASAPDEVAGATKVLAAQGAHAEILSLRGVGCVEPTWVVRVTADLAGHAKAASRPGRVRR